MKNITKQTTPSKGTVVSKQRSYSEVVEFLDAHWKTNVADKSLRCIKKLDQAFGGISKKVNAIFVAGTNGKSLTANFTSQLLKEEGLTVGTLYAPHLLTYNERFAINHESIANKTFTDVANEVINTAQTLELQANTADLLTMMGLLYFTNNNVDAAILEVSKGSADPVTICIPKITAITRVNADKPEDVPTIIDDLLRLVKKDTHVVSADQSKLNLQIMHKKAVEKGGVWGMPIRKLVALTYPFEQLHGRCAALAERIVFVYMNTFVKKGSTIVNQSLLMKQKGQRGRPTLEAKRQQELNPKRTVEHFWKETVSTLPGRFQLLDKEKPTVLLDIASTLDAFDNVLLGIRLLHYQRPLKGLTLVLGSNNAELDLTEFLKRLRYFFKKTSGQVVVCPVQPKPGHKDVTSWNVEKVTNDIKSMKIKATCKKTFKEAFEMAAKTVDERHGLVVVVGSPSLITEYWNYKGIKKL